MILYPPTTDHWPRIQLKYHVRVVSGYPFDSTKFNFNQGMRLVRIRDLLEQNGEVLLTTESVPEAEIKDGDLLIGMDGDFNLAEWRGGRALLNQRVCKVIPRTTAEPDFLLYVLPHHLKAINDVTYSTTVKHLSTFDVGNISLRFPSPVEQRRIAGYLDEQMEKIDRLMDMRKRQMALLKEQRAALIQQAVTRGLNPKVPMKDSGLPWLGEIPAHWEVTQLRRIINTGTSITYGIVQAGPHIEGGVPYIRTSDMSGDALPIEGYLCTTPEIDRSYQRSKVKTSDVVVAIRATIGKALPVPPELDGANLTQGTAKVSPGSRVTTGFLLVALRCESARQQFASLAKGTTFLEITLDMLRRFTIPLPPLNEQLEIVSFINTETATLDNLHTAYTRQLSLLAEYRAALIHECVTGQRTVRQRTMVEATPTKANIHFLRAVLCSEIVHRLYQEPTFGRVKLEKFLYLSEAYAGIDLAGRYQRGAAGPFDNQALRSAESQIQKQKWYQPVKGEKGTRYVPMENAGGHQKYFSRYWPEQQPKFDRLVNLLRSFTTERCEIVATLFAVWNDRLRADQPCTDADIVDEVLTQWHPSKQRIARERWLSALQWMKQERLTP